MPSPNPYKLSPRQKQILAIALKREELGRDPQEVAFHATLSQPFKALKLRGFGLVEFELGGPRIFKLTPTGRRIAKTLRGDYGPEGEAEQ